MSDEAKAADLNEFLERSLQFESKRAELSSSQRFDLAVKIRVGLITLNAASALGVATLFGAITASVRNAAGVQNEIMAFAFFFFVVGAWMAGWSLNSMYVDAIDREGDATTTVLIRSRVISESRLERSESLEQLSKIPFVRQQYDQGAIHFQAWSWGMWGTGAIAIAYGVASHSLAPHLTTALEHAKGWLSQLNCS